MPDFDTADDLTISSDALDIVGYADALTVDLLPRVVPPVFRIKGTDRCIFPPFAIDGGQVCYSAESTTADLDHAIDEGEATRIEQPIPAQVGYRLWISSDGEVRYERSEDATARLRDIAQHSIRRAHQALAANNPDLAVDAAQVALAADEACVDAVLLKAIAYRRLGMESESRYLLGLLVTAVPGVDVESWIESYTELLQAIRPQRVAREVARQAWARFASRVFRAVTLPFGRRSIIPDEPSTALMFVSSGYSTTVLVGLSLGAGVGLLTVPDNWAVQLTGILSAVAFVVLGIALHSVSTSQVVQQGILEEDTLRLHARTWGEILLVIAAIAGGLGVSRPVLGLSIFLSVTSSTAALTYFLRKFVTYRSISARDRLLGEYIPDPSYGETSPALRAVDSTPTTPARGMRRFLVGSPYDLITRILWRASRSGFAPVVGLLVKYILPRPKTKDAFKVAAVVSYYERQYALSLEFATAGIEFASRLGSIPYILISYQCLARSALGDRAMAIGEMRRALDWVPHNYYLRSMLSYLFWSDGQIGSALQAARTALSLGFARRQRVCSYTSTLLAFLLSENALDQRALGARISREECGLSLRLLELARTELVRGAFRGDDVGNWAHNIGLACVLLGETAPEADRDELMSFALNMFARGQWREGHRGCRLRLAIFHMIASRSYRSAEHQFRNILRGMEKRQERTNSRFWSIVLLNFRRVLLAREKGIMFNHRILWLHTSDPARGGELIPEEAVLSGEPDAMASERDLRHRWLSSLRLFGGVNSPLYRPLPRVAHMVLSNAPEQPWSLDGSAGNVDGKKLSA